MICTLVLRACQRALAPAMQSPTVLEETVELKAVSIRVPAGVNLVLGQAHFVKTAEDLAEAIVSSVPRARFAVAFNEASGPCLVRVEGNDDALKRTAAEHALAVGAGHAFVILLRDCFPVNVLTRIKDCFEVCTVFCASANPVDVLVAETTLGRGIVGVVDGARPRGVESAADVEDRRRLLRKLGYKL
jgi:adenosine/AMP kinase